MSVEKDSISLKTVIPYPKSDISSTRSETTIEKRISFEGERIIVPTYDTVLIYFSSFIFLCVIFIIFISKKGINRDYLLNEYIVVRKKEDRRLHLGILEILQHVVSILVFTSIVYYFVNYYGNYSYTLSVVYSITTLTVYFLFRTFLIFFTSYLLSKKKLFIEHHYIVRYFNKIFGLLLIPFVFLALTYPQRAHSIITYSLIILISIKVIIVCFHIYKLLRARKFSQFHSFLYLCTLEVLPLLYVVVFVSNLMNNN